MNIAGAPGGIQVRQSWACVSARFSAETTSVTPFIPKKNVRRSPRKHHTRTWGAVPAISGYLSTVSIHPSIHPSIYRSIDLSTYLPI